MTAEGKKASYNLPVVNYDALMDLKCRDDYHLSKWYSTYSTTHWDRRYASASRYRGSNKVTFNVNTK